jgi:hypothetical protein
VKRKGLIRPRFQCSTCALYIAQRAHLDTRYEIFHAYRILLRMCSQPRLTAPYEQLSCQTGQTSIYMHYNSVLIISLCGAIILRNNAQLQAKRHGINVANPLNKLPTLSRRLHNFPMANNQTRIKNGRKELNCPERLGIAVAKCPKYKTAKPNKYQKVPQAENTHKSPNAQLTSSRNQVPRRLAVKYGNWGMCARHSNDLYMEIHRCVTEDIPQFQH